VLLALTGCARVHYISEMNRTEKVTDYPELNTVVTHGRGKIVAKSAMRTGMRPYLEILKPTQFGYKEGESNNKCWVNVMPTKAFKKLTQIPNINNKKSGCFGPVDYTTHWGAIDSRMNWLCPTADSSDPFNTVEGSICLYPSGIIKIWIHYSGFALKQGFDHIKISDGSGGAV